MNINKVFRIYNKIKKRLPYDYPRPMLVFFTDQDDIRDFFKIKDIDHEFYAVMEPQTGTISIPLFFYTTAADGKKNFISLEEEKIAFVLLHEIGHFYALDKYGFGEKYNDENYCNRFARRWVRKMKKEGLIAS